MSVSIRLLQEIDLLAADRLLELAFQRPASHLADLRRYRQIQPDGWFGAFQQELIVGMVGAVNYGSVAHVGLMAVLPEMQRHGIGLALMQHLLAWLDGRGVPLVTLDASPMGRSLYEKLGFLPYDDTLIYQYHGNFKRVAQADAVRPITNRDLHELAEWDKPFFGAVRIKVLQAYMESFPAGAILIRDESGKLAGYLFAQDYGLGPWVAQTQTAADTLLQTALTLRKAPRSAAVPSVNHSAIALLEGTGFERVRANLHMGRGSSQPPGDRTRIYAQASLAIG